MAVHDKCLLSLSLSPLPPPFQVNGRFSVELLEDPHEKDVQELAAMLGLRKVRGVLTKLLIYTCVSCDCHVTSDWLDLH